MSKPYSGSNPIPKVTDFLKETATLGQAKKSNDKPHPSTREQTKALRKGEGLADGNQREVDDPTTGGRVEIEDAKFDTEKTVDDPHIVVPNANLPGYEDKPGVDKPYTDATQNEKDYAEKQDVTAPPDPVAPHTTTDVPIHGEKTNILFHPTPTLSLSDTVFATFEQRAVTLCGGIFAAIVVLGYIIGGGSFFSLLVMGAGVSGGVWYWAKGVMDEARTVDWASEKKRGETATNNLIPESVEWMNRLVGLLWSLVNPEMFASIADQLEDVMQASVPGVIENVRVADISQGSNPLRILSLRALPDHDAADLKKAAVEGRQGKDEQEKLAEEEGGEVYNIEASFAYNAAPVDRKGGLSQKSRNMHMQLVFYLGVKGLFGMPIPIWVELKGLVGTVRMRLQLAPDPPFLKTLTFTLMGIPQVAVSCIPMVESGINVLNLPIISQFVNASIATAANEYVAPKSMSMELGKVLVGDDVKKDTEALGVLWININRALGLSSQDRSGSSDAYITLAFSKYEKPMYSTRVIVSDLNPIWNESTAIIVTADHIKANEALSVELWDSDRMTADDMVGKVEISLHELVLNPGRMHNQVSHLAGEGAGSAMPGELHWSVGFFGKSQLRPALRTSGKDVNLPNELKDHPELQDAKGSLYTSDEDAIMHTPPDPLFPSGILSIILHQIVNLEVKNQTGTYENRKNGKEYSPGQETGENTQEEGGKLPSSYCTIALNDLLVYRTRTKVVSSKPIFNAGTERFIRDWRSAIVTVAVRDQRQREHDPLLGVVPLKISELLQTTSEVTRWFPLDGGLGFGRIRLSILFRSLELSLPPPLLGWDVGTFEFLGNISSTLSSGGKLKLRTGGSTGKIPAKNCSSTDSGGVEWNVIVGSKGKKKLRLPVRHRYMSPVTIDVWTSSSSRKPAGQAMLWLDTLTDNEVKTVTIPVWRSKDAQRLTQNYIVKPEDDTSLELEELGTLTFECTFSPGMDNDHVRFATDNDTREIFEVWQEAEANGQRGQTVHTETNRVVDRLHDRSVREMREDLANTDTSRIDADDERRLTDKYGKSWRDVFRAAEVADLGVSPNTRGGGDGSDRLQPVNAYPKFKPYRVTRYYEDEDDDDEQVDSSDDEASGPHSDDSYHHVESDDPSPEADEAADEEEAKKHSGPIGAIKEYRKNQRTMHRNHRGLMQWKPMRSLAFAKDETKFGIRKIANKMKLKGREPDVETEV